MGVDTHSWHHALKNTLRQAPDVILIGEIRDAETMEHAIAFAETGHLCLGTLHANSANQTIERIINFFPEERRNQLLMDLSANLRAIVSQRLVRTRGRQGRARRPSRSCSTRRPSPSGSSRANSTSSRASWTSRASWACAPSTGRCSSCTTTGQIGFEEAIRNADSANELRLNIKLKSERGEPSNASGMSLSMEAKSEPKEEEAKK